MSESNIISKKKILIVDDLYSNRLFLSMIIRKMEMDYAFAEHGKKAIELLETENIDAILMDIEMPIMDGLEATRKIRANSKTSHIPIIAITSHDPNDFFFNAVDIGFTALMTKPYSFERLKETLDKIFNA